MAAITICSDFGAQKNKVCRCFHCFSIYFPWSDETRCHDLSFLNVQKTFRKRQLEYINLLFIICAVHLLYTKQWEYTDERQSNNSDKYLSCYGSTSMEWLNKKFECVHVCMCVSARKLRVCLLSCVWLFEAPWAVAHQSVHVISQARILEWVAISFSEGLPDPGIKPMSPAQAGGFFTVDIPEKPRKWGWGTENLIRDNFPEGVEIWADSLRICLPLWKTHSEKGEKAWEGMANSGNHEHCWLAAGNSSQVLGLRNSKRWVRREKMRVDHEWSWMPFEGIWIHPNNFWQTTERL